MKDRLKRAADLALPVAVGVVLVPLGLLFAVWFLYMLLGTLVNLF
jgi:hypothetical protein